MLKGDHADELGRLRLQVAELKEAQARLLNTEQALRESEDNFRTFFETMDDMIIIGTPDGKIVYANPALSKKLGYNEQELLMMHILDLHPPSSRKEAEKIFSEMFAGDRDWCPLPVQTKDGFAIPVETRVWFGKWSGVNCTFGICKDLSKEQEALQKFDRLFRSNPALMAVTSVPKGVISDVNESFLQTLGFERREVIGKTAEDLRLFVLPEMHCEAAKQLETHCSISNVELQVRRKDGSILDGLFSGEIIESQGEKSFLTVMMDLTERNRMEKQNVQLVEELKEALAEVKKLSGILPICASCKKIRDEQGRWIQIETYVAAHSEADFTHGICPECMRNLYPEFQKTVSVEQD